MGKVKRHWQDFEWVLGLFDDRLGVERRRYKAFMAKGWAAVKQMRRAKMFEKSDKHILGN